MTGTGGSTPEEQTPDRSTAAERRRALLATYGVLEDHLDAGFEALVDLAVQVCRTPMAAVTLVDDTQLSFKAQRGLGLDSMAMESSFCVHALNCGAEVTVVPDTVADSRFVDNRLVTGPPGVRSYAGAPLVTPEGVVLGTVCVLDVRPRDASAAERAALQSLAALAVELLEARRNASRNNTLLAREREEALQLARTNERFLTAVFDNAAVGVLLLDLDGHIVRANGAFAAMVGRKTEELSGTSFAAITDPSDIAQDVALVAQLLTGEMTNVVREKRYHHSDGSLVTAVSSTTVIRGAGGRATGLLSTVESIDDRRRAEQSLLEAQSAIDAIITADAGGRIVAWNDGAERMFGYSRSQALRQPVSLIVSDQVRSAHRDRFARLAAGDVSSLVGQTVEVTGLRRDGSLFPVELAVSRWTFDDRPRYTAVVRDVTERKALHAELVRRATSDAVTGVGNRAWLAEAVAAALQAPEAKPLSVLAIEFAGLREVDESLGLILGDRIVTEVARQLSATVRPGDALARIDNGDFAVLLPATTTSQAAVVAQRLRDAIPDHFRVHGAPIAISARVGMANHRGGIGGARAAASAALLLRNATLALTTARTSPTRTATYEPAMSARARRRLKLHGGLQGAIGRGELSLVYQPQIDLTTSRLHAVEALLRWQHPSLGAISPTEFIPLAEDTGLATELGSWVLLEACQQAARWSQELREPLHISVNVSGYQLLDPAVAGTLVGVLHSTGLHPSLLTLEITESVLLGELDAVRTRLEEIRSLGVQIAVDDFGTGYSGLATLAKMPVDELKIDGAFIAGLPDPVHHTVTRAIIELGRALDLRIVAEGIETPEQHAALVGLECALGQGYLFGHPMAAEAITEWGTRRLRVVGKPA